MSEPLVPHVAIVDYGMGNLFSVKHACSQVGLRASITSSRAILETAEAVILPGVGAFGDAMQVLTELDLAVVLRDHVAAGKPLLGICLGMQLLMSESQEFGLHKGLGIIEGDVVRLEHAVIGERTLKVPQVGWNTICQRPSRAWEGSLLDGLPDEVFMYFVHSFYPRPADARVGLSMTRYGPTTFCSSLQHGNVFACQFHPERSGAWGLRIYQNLARFLNAGSRVPRSTVEVHHV